MEETIETEVYKLPLIGDKAPSFEAITTQGKIKFPEDYKGKWIILFSHPADFTPVCTTEFMTFATMSDEFKELNTELVGLSIDSLYAHIAWLQTIKDKIKWDDMENVDVKFPLIEDIKMDVSKKYGMIQPKQSNTQAVRAVFIIDPKGIIRAILYYPLSTGRNIEEIKRIIQALQKTDQEKVATPANWKPGDDVIVPPPETSSSATKRVIGANDDMYCLDWFMCFKQDI